MIASPQYLTPDDYLQLEAESHIKHEYIDGEVYAMAGASDHHVTIAGNLFALLRSQVRGTGCRVYISDMKVRMETRNRFYYPDVMVTCDERDQETANYKRFPKLIVEVLSESTEAFDRGQKFRHYRHIETLREYVLIDPDQMSVECYRLNENQRWELYHYATSPDRPEDCQVELTSIELAFPIHLLYEDIDQLDNS